LNTSDSILKVESDLELKLLV